MAGTRSATGAGRKGKAAIVEDDHSQDAETHQNDLVSIHEEVEEPHEDEDQFITRADLHRVAHDLHAEMRRSMGDFLAHLRAGEGTSRQGPPRIDNEGKVHGKVGRDDQPRRIEAQRKTRGHTRRKNGSKVSYPSHHSPQASRQSVRIDQGPGKGGASGSV